MPTRAELSEAVRDSCRDWVEIYTEQPNAELSVRSLLSGCEQRLCELLDMPRPERAPNVDHVAFGNGRHCGSDAHQRFLPKV